MATGDLTLFGARRAFPVWNKYVVTADETPEGLGGDCVVGDILCMTAGTIDAVWDMAGGPTGLKHITTKAMAANERLSFGGGDGQRFQGGIYFEITGGTYVVLAMPSA